MENISDVDLTTILVEYTNALNGRHFADYYRQTSVDQLSRVRFIKYFHTVITDVCQSYLHTVDASDTNDIVRELCNNQLLVADMKQFYARCTRLLKRAQAQGRIN